MKNTSLILYIVIIDYMVLNNYSSRIIRKFYFCLIPGFSYVDHLLLICELNNFTYGALLIFIIYYTLVQWVVFIFFNKYRNTIDMRIYKCK